MVITIKNNDGTTTYDVNAISENQVKSDALIIINKVGTLETLTEALNFTIATHRGNLETLLKERTEAIVEDEDNVAETEETSNEEEADS